MVVAERAMVRGEFEYNWRDYDCGFGGKRPFSRARTERYRGIRRRSHHARTLTVVPLLAIRDRATRWIEEAVVVERERRHLGR